MKHLYLWLLFISMGAFGQQKGLNYQAVILDPNTIEIPGQVIVGQPLAKGKVWVRFTLISGAGIDYEEIQQTSTDEFGLINLTIGAGNSTASLGSNASTGLARYSQFDSILWDEKLKRLKVSVNFTGSGNYTEVSNQQLTFTPYALYAESVDYKNVRDAPKSLSQFNNDVGYLVPKDLEPLKKDVGGAIVGMQENAAKIEANNLRFVVIDQTVSKIADQVDRNTSELKQVNTNIITLGNALTEQEVRIQQNASQIQNTSLSILGQLGNLQNQISVTQNTLSNMTTAYELAANKSSALDLGNSQPSNSLYPTQLAVKSYVDNALTNVVTTGTPDATTLATGKVQLAGDLAGAATAPTVPGLALKESLANKSTDVSADGTSNTKYPSAKAVKDYVDIATTGIAFQAALNAKADINSPTFIGTPFLPLGSRGVTQSPGNNSTSLATTSFVQMAMANATVADADATTKGKVQLAGDLGGTAVAPIIAKLQGATLSSSAPTLGQVLKYNGTAWVPDDLVLVEAQTLSLSGSTLTISGTNSSVVLPIAADATSSTNGILRLAGDLGGAGSTAVAPVISDNAITTAKLASGAVTDAKFSGILSLSKGGTGSSTKNFVDLTTHQIIAGDKSFTGTTTTNDLNGTNGFFVSSLGTNGPTSLGSTLIVNGNLTLNGTSNAVNNISAGTWNGSTIEVARGGTGANSLTGMLKGNGTFALSQAVINTDYSLVRFVSDEYTIATPGQTTFILTQTPNINSTIRLFINGVRISKKALSVSGTTLTYNSANNGAASLIMNDRVQIDYYY